LRSRIALLVLVVAVVTACAPTDQSFEIAAAVLMHRNAQRDDFPSAPSVAFVSVVADNEPDEDMPTELLKRMSNCHIIYRPGSACSRQWHLAPSNGGCTLYGVSRPRRNWRGEIEVNWGYYCGVVCASGHRAVVEFDENKWRVVSDDMNWIS
jgi:hypothetical protein